MQQRIQRRSLRASVASAVLASLTVLLSAFSLGMASPAGAQDDSTTTTVEGTDTTTADSDSVDGAAGQIRILEVSGLLDPVVFDFLMKEIDAAEADNALAIVLQVDSKASVLNDEKFVQLASRLRDTDLQVVGWVGPSGAEARGGAAELLGLADVVGVAAGSRLGDTGEARLPSRTFDEAFGDATGRLTTETISAREAIELGIAPGSAADDAQLQVSIENNSVLREFVRVVDGFQAPTPSDEDPALLGQAQFRQLTLSGQLFHTAASPEVAYLFFAGGLMLLVFELFTAGVGIAGLIGVGLFTLGSYGLGVLPARPLGIVLLILAILAFAVDIQTNIPRFYTALGMALFVIGTFTLYDGLSMSWVTIGFGIVGAALYAYSGMPSMVRTRFSTPTIGRQWMIGAMGEAVSDLSPEGMVRINDAPWRAITNRATPLKSGDAVRVVGIDRLVLEVEPEAGGAKDYRDRG